GQERSEMGEPVADLRIQPKSEPTGFEIGGDLVPRLIDEIPVLAVLATQCRGRTLIRDAAEMRVKETDRIAVMVDGLQRMGAEIQATEDGMIIQGPTALTGAQIDAAGDHRIGMAFAVAGTAAQGETVIRNAESIRTSYPGFWDHMEELFD
ncbi:MAG: hypothetical protein MH204_12665, partial [Fimbriimonadaceae bacterium]|nr:hypothetical protein [Fimbriimonadaceae bacterium]